MSIVNQIPQAAKRLQEQLLELEEYLPQLEAIIAELDINWGALQKGHRPGPGLGLRTAQFRSGFIGGVVSGVSTFVIGLIFSFYILLQKETQPPGPAGVLCHFAGALGGPGCWRCCGWQSGRFPASSPASVWKPAFWGRCSWWP